ncbi:DUF305 domain-containing protein [Cognatilysobacter bugurensis]|uniref:DUF305 domain-containing protein n=1 Tax=Cognatilysobacter bugurensis TaxID=543356 RepID=A0A918T2Q6_9GAMM|nr:DUF305 domain-containing protein [Lysobacter bugurensis]GHA87614.1 hypothetical protein GCM10007067_27010 [Lysobacter bugurensis]
MQSSYWRFAAMIATSTVVMFGLMYLTTYALDHVFWSETRAWMALLMGATMAIIMLGFMLGMYKKRALNIAIFAGAAAVFAVTLWIVRSQSTVDGVDYMRAMIPHHSIAVMTSERAQITDPRVRKLADEIIAAQRREIAEMKYLIARLDDDGAGKVAALNEPAAPPELVSPREAITSAEIAKVDLGEFDNAEVERVLGPGRRCMFHYSQAAGPVLAATADAGVVKIHGRLVQLDATSQSARGVALRGGGITVAVKPDAEASDGAWQEAVARLHLAAGLDVGYRGFYRCVPAGARGRVGR